LISSRSAQNCGTETRERERETLVHFRNFDKRSKLKATSRDKDLKHDEGKVRRDN